MPYADKNSPQAIAFRKRNAEKARIKYHTNEMNRKSQIERSAKWNRENKSRLNLGAQKRRLKTIPLSMLLEVAKIRAKKKNVEFNISEVDLVLVDVCPILGIELKINIGFAKDNSFSIDRIDNSKGYVKGNVRLISYRANSLKSDASVEEMVLILEDFNRLGG